MAPSATETVTQTVRDISDLKLTTNPYKELAPVGYEKDAELKGKDGFKAAKVGLSGDL
jgi:sulfonate dioxygenase